MEVLEYLKCDLWGVFVIFLGFFKKTYRRLLKDGQAFGRGGGRLDIMYSSLLLRKDSVDPIQTGIFHTVSLVQHGVTLENVGTFVGIFSRNK